MSQKFGIEVLTLVKRAYNINNEAGTYLWIKSIAKDIINSKVTYVKKEGTPDQI